MSDDSTPTPDSVHHAATVPAPPEKAFSAFTDGLERWWPQEYTWSGEVLDTIRIEPRRGGRCFERGPHDFECDWGRVLAWDPPHRLVFSWQISPERVPEPDPSRASEVEVRFSGEGGRATRIEIEHRGFLRHGEGAAAYRAAMDSDQGWPWLLALFVATLDDGT